MNQAELVLSADPHLRQELTEQLGDGHDLVFCDSLAQLPRILQDTPVRAVLVHICKSVLGESSAGRFMSELTDVVKNAPIYALVDPACPTRLRRLARGSADVLLPMPLDYGRLKTALARQPDLAAELEGLWKDLPHRVLRGLTRSMVTFTPSMFEMLDDLTVAARHDVTVLLVGETGSGKTYLARLIHELSERRDERFCTVSCGALPPDLIESELFGYAKGAFTGADRDKQGKFSAAGGGTLLLDEIDVTHPEQQTKLLRVIETGEYEPIGSNETQRSRARLVVASNHDLEALVQSGSFRTDLYYRLNVLSFRLPPLHERPWDIEYLARKFALEHSNAHGIQLREIEPAFLDALRVYRWPGNIREMENVIRRAVLYCQRGVLSVADLPSGMRSAIDEVASDEGDGNGGGNGDNGRLAKLTSKNGPLATVADQAIVAEQETVEPDSGPSDSKSSPVGAIPTTLEDRMDILERRIIEDSLRRNQHRRKETAEELGISRVTLYNKMKKFGLLG